MEENARIGSLLLNKFVNEEIMTKSEFQLSIDRIMDKHEISIENKFHNMENKFHNMETKIDHRYNWITGIVVTSVIGIIGLIFKMMSMIPH